MSDQVADLSLRLQFAAILESRRVAERQRLQQSFAGASPPAERSRRPSYYETGGQGVRQQDRRVLVDGRTNRAALLDSGAVRRGGPRSLGARLAAAQCPCPKTDDDCPRSARAR